MNVTSYQSSRSSYQDPRYSNSASPMPPSAKALFEGYRSALDPNEDESPRYNPLNYSHPRSSVLLNANDPVAMHLLAETALSDSIQFEVLSFEEVEELKKELLLLSNRIEASKRKLSLEMKLQETALSLSKLYESKGARRESSDSSPESSPKSHRRRLSFFGRHSLQHRSDEELTLSMRRCEEISQELWKLERRAGDIRRRILEHTAGILQMTHRGLKKKASPRQERNGDFTEFDDRSLYKTSDALDEFGAGHTRRDLSGPPDGERNSVSLTALHDTKKRLDDLNSRLREMILVANPNQDVDRLETSNGTPADPVIAVQTGLDTLDKRLESMAFQQTQVLQGMESSMYNAEDRLEHFNKRLDDVLVIAGSTRPQLTPRTSAMRKNLEEQLDYLEQIIEDAELRIGNLTEQKTILTTQIQQQRELNSKSDAERDAHFADLTEQIVKLEKESERSQKDADTLRDELSQTTEQLDTMRQGSMARSQQEEANRELALLAEKEARQMAEQDLARNQDEMAGSIQARKMAEEALALKENEVAALEQTRKEFALELEKIRQDLALKEDQLVTLEEFRDRTRGDLDAVAQDQAAREHHIAGLQSELEQLRSERNTGLEGQEGAKKELEKLQIDYAELESEMVRIQTELTFARAELDGAYGSRSERAALVAANPAIQRELDELNQRNMSLTEELATLRDRQSSKSNTAASPELQERVQMLEKELRETIDDYENLTKASIEFEKERDKFESVIDSYRDRCEALEAQLSDERIQAMAVGGSRRGDGTPTESTSMMVLKNEFKKMMRDTRAENVKILRAEQEERRKLEALVRTLKKESLGKSNLSQSTVPS